MRLAEAIRSTALLAGCALGFASCESLPQDDFKAAEITLHRGDLLSALFHLDCVPPTDPRYPESRAMAQAIERRIRLSHDLVDEGMQLRAEWRDREACTRFQQALEIWPELATARVVLEATRQRIDALEKPRDVPDSPAGSVVQSSPVGLDGGATAGGDPATVAQGEGGQAAPITEPGTAAPLSSIATDPSEAQPGTDGVATPVAAETPVAEGAGEPGADPSSSAQPAAPAGETVVGVDNWTKEVERELSAGRLEQALQIAEAQTTPIPSSKLRESLVQMLHQRALLRYGHGALELALHDWVRLQRIDPNHVEAAEFAAAARAELAR